MIDPRDHERRLDFRSLDLAPDRAREDAVIAATMGRLPPSINVQPLLVLRRQMALAAAVLATIAAASVLVARTRPPVGGDALLLGWTETGHVPTNGELLAVYHGYQP